MNLLGLVVLDRTVVMQIEHDGERVNKSVRLSGCAEACGVTHKNQLRRATALKWREAQMDFAYSKHGKQFREHMEDIPMRDEDVQRVVRYHILVSGDMNVDWVKLEYETRPACPACGSKDSIYRGSGHNHETGYTGADSDELYCGLCGHHWTDGSDE